MAEGVRYRILAVVGEGGFGRVYRARMETDDGFTKDVAIKVLSDREPASSLIRRFRDEAKILGLLRDRAIVTADPPIQLDGRWAVVMEFVDGVSLGTLLNQGPIPPGVALEVVGEVARALHHAFQQEGPEGQPLQLLHRDIKPDNIQLTPSGEVKLLDFGIARANFKEREYKTRHALGGTPGYIAPERMQGIELPAGDVHSLGVVLHEAVTRIRPKFGPTVEIKDGEILAPMEDLELEEHHRKDPHLMQVVALAAWMRSDEVADRPAAREVEDWCRKLRQRLPPPYLREWAESEVPHRNVVPEDEVVGQVLSQSAVAATPTGAPRTSSDDNRTVLNPTALPYDTAGPSLPPTGVIPGATVPTNESSRIAIGAMLGGGVTLIALLAISVITVLLTIAVWSLLNNARLATQGAAPEPGDPAPAEMGPDSEDPVPVEPTPGAPEPAAPAPPQPPRTIVVVDPERPTPQPTRPVVPISDPVPEPVPEPVPVVPAPPSRTGIVLVRTIPTGGAVYKGDTRLREVGGGYALPVGTHLLRIVSPDGVETTSLAVNVSQGATVPICYDFTSNSACAR